MPESLNVLAPTQGGLPTPLLLLNGPVETVPALMPVTTAIARGTIMFAADTNPATVWAKAVPGTSPAATDVVGIVLEDCPAPASGSNKHYVAIKGHFSEAALFGTGNPTGVYSLANKVAAQELMLRQGITTQLAY